MVTHTMLVLTHRKDLQNTQGGFVTLYATAVVVAMVTIATSLGVVGGIESRISTTGTLSQRAQYYAESAIECGMYAVVADIQAGARQYTSCGGNTVDSRETDIQTLFFEGGGCARLTIASDRIHAHGYDQGNATSGQCPTGARVQQSFSVRIE